MDSPGPQRARDAVPPLPRPFTPRTVRVLVVLITALLAVGRLVGLDFFGVTENRLFDGVVLPLLPATPTDARIVIVEIDDRTLVDLGERWPLKRSTWAQFFRRLATYDPSSVAADVMFDLPELDNERSILDELRQRVARSSWFGTAPGIEMTSWIDAIDERADADQELGQALGDLGRVTLGLLCTGEAGFRTSPVLRSPLSHDGAELETRAEQVMSSHPGLALASRSSGAMNVIIDSDGTVRRYPYAIAVGDTAWPSLALAVGLGDLGADQQEAMLTRIVAADGATPTLRFRAPEQAWPRVSFSDVILAPTPGGLQRLLSGKIVLVGGNAIGIEDLQRTPMVDRAPGVELHATALENLTQGTWLEKSGPAAWTGALVTMLMVIAFAFLLGQRLRARWMALYLVAAMGTYLTLTVIVASEANMILALVPLPFGMLALTLVEGLYRSSEVRRERQMLLERDRLHEAERMVLEGFRRVVEHVGDAMISTDARHRVRWMNPAAEVLLQRRITASDGVSIGELVPRLASPEVSASTGIIEAEAQVAGADEAVPVEATAMPMAIGSEVWTNYVIRDTSMRKALEKQKDTFVASLSHELRTPLTSILGSLRLVAQGVVGEIPSQAHDLLEIASQNGERLLVLVNDLLDAAKIAAGELALDRLPISVSDLMALALARISGFAVRFGVRLEATPIPEAIASRQVEVDADRIVEVLGNLISNAVKHTPSGGVVTLAASPGDDDMLRITVSDRGPGIRSSHIGILFDKFSRAAPADGRRRPGTGLGLSITKELVEAHGGRIGVDSQVGLGSNFWVELGPMLARTDLS